METRLLLTDQCAFALRGPSLSSCSISRRGDETCDLPSLPSRRTVPTRSWECSPFRLSFECLESVAHTIDCEMLEIQRLAMDLCVADALPAVEH